MKLEILLSLLRGRPPGPITSRQETDAVRAALSECWDRLTGSDDTSMRSAKLWRAQNFCWNPPILSFGIERHGGTALGSSRAERQRWEIDTESGEARWEVIGYRQVRPRQRPWDARAAADEIADAILAGRDDERLQRLPDGRVKVLTGSIVPPGPRETTEGRRRRFNLALASRLEQAGWRRAGGGWWRPPAAGLAADARAGGLR